MVYTVVYISISISLSSIGQTRMETSQESELEQVTHLLTMLASSSGTPMMSCVEAQSASMSWGFLGASACSQNKLEERSSMQGFKLEQVLPTPGEAKAKAMPGRLYIHTKIINNK